MYSVTHLGKGDPQIYRLPTYRIDNASDWSAAYNGEPLGREPSMLDLFMPVLLSNSVVCCCHSVVECVVWSQKADEKEHDSVLG